MRLWAAVMVPAVAFGGTVTVRTEGWTGTGTREGWRYAGLDAPYAEGTAKFASGGDEIRSPRFAGDVRRIAVSYRCSSANPARRLRLTAYAGEERVYGPRELTPAGVGASAVRNYAREEFELEAARRADSLRLALGEGASGNWGVASIEVTLDANRAYGLRATRVGSTTFSAAWSNGADVAACELCLFTTRPVPFSASCSDTLDFSFISNPSGSLRSVAPDLLARWPFLGGFELNAPASSAGLFMIGSSTRPGLLTLAYPRPYSDKTLLLTASRFPTRENDEGSVMPLYYLHAGLTNTLAVLTLPDSPHTFTIPLSSVPDGAVLAFSSVTNRIRATRANARTLVSSIAFATSVTPAHVETNEFLRLTTTASRARINGLTPLTDYLWSVRGIDAAGQPAVPSDFHTLKTKTPTGCRVGVW